MKFIEIEVQKRFNDVDSFMHVNNVAQQMYFDLGKTDFYHRVMEEEVVIGRERLVTVSTHTDYRGQIRFDDRLVVRTGVDRLGNKSLTMYQQLVRLGADGTERLCTESRSVMVAFDFESQQSIEIPGRWRRRIEER